MLGIDYTFIDFFNEKENSVNSSLAIFSLDIIKGFCEKGLKNEICIIVKKKDYEEAKILLPEIKIIPYTNILTEIIKLVSFGKKAGSRFLYNKLFYDRLIKKNGLDIIWFPYATYYCYTKSNCLKIYTIHDLIPYHKTKKYHRQYKSLIKSIYPDKTKIITVSEDTKKDLLATFNVSNEITVIPNSVTIDSQIQTSKNLVSGDYILDINFVDERKNGLTLLKAFNQIKNQIDIKLVFCGYGCDQNYYKIIQKYISDNKLDDKVFFFFKIPENEKNWLYANAKLLVTPSTSEGFGRSCIEAALYKIPVIASSLSAIIESSLGLLNYYGEPNNYVSLASNILKVLKNYPSVPELERIAKKLNSFYSRDIIVEKYIKVYESFNY